MNSFRDVIAAWPRLKDFAADIGVTENYAAQMKHKDMIRAPYFAAVVAAASRRGLDGITLLRLCELAEAKKQRVAV